jgi:hypothetical protein
VGRGGRTKPTNSSVAEFIGAIIDPAKRRDAETLVKVLEGVAGEKPRMWGPSIIGFGSCHYRYETGREGDMPLISFSPRKAATVLYNVIQSEDCKTLLAKLGKHTTGKGCLYIKKLSDVDQEVLKAIVVESVAAMRKR